MWGWVLCPEHKEQALGKGQNLWDDSEPRTEKASFPFLQSKTQGALISPVSSLGNVFMKPHLIEQLIYLPSIVLKVFQMQR